ncbi:type II toxin-antitoxin system antitoxin SocA domain-containing protein [Romboutsia lituseburensis]|uniref:type II toxin-antitoxin system antitoxin SocA domain-containing protein n=1 Tax=Romboutsia lituseburensis TaxID=1537 RepID=UPI0022EB70B5|nr:type II toxin-antitoxin system antitoxin SocA domain-containing protein [Romboutsia lituseburensis]
MKGKVYCEVCDSNVSYNTKYEHIKETVNKIEIEYKGTNAYCDKCNNEVFVDDIDEQNTKIVNEIYRSKMGIISTNDIELILKKYNIGASVLSKLLNWGEVTIPRYVAGQTPSKEYSDKLRNILNNPSEMYKLLNDNKDNITSVAYNKCKNAIEDILDELCVDKVDELDIEVLAKYIVNKKDITPKALQKNLYFIQGFSLAFNDKPLFNDMPQAWIHGPVYPKIYSKYKSYQYNVIDSEEDVRLNISESSKQIIDYVLKFLGCYSGDILEEITHMGLPWKNARKGLLDDEISSNFIELDNIKQYFESVKCKYNMINLLDIKDYAVDMFNKVI